MTQHLQAIFTPEQHFIILYSYNVAWGWKIRCLIKVPPLMLPCLLSRKIIIMLGSVTEMSTCPSPARRDCLDSRLTDRFNCRGAIFSDEFGNWLINWKRVFVSLNDLFYFCVSSQVSLVNGVAKAPFLGWVVSSNQQISVFVDLSVKFDGRPHYGGFEFVVTWGV